MITIARHKKSRHWAIWQNDTLIAVVCYKKGASAIKQILDRHIARSKPIKLTKPIKAPARFKARRLKP